MAFIITQGELEYQAGLCYVGVAYKVFLATTGSLTLTSTLTAWEAAELTATNGYSAVTGTISAGAWNSTANRFEMPAITGQFSATGAGYTFDAQIIKLAGRSKPYAINLYDTPITLAAGQARGFSHTPGQKR